VICTYGYIACLPITTLRGQGMAMDACLAANAGTEFACLCHLFDGAEWTIDGRADVIYGVWSAFVVKVRSVKPLGNTSQRYCRFKSTRSTQVAPFRATEMHGGSPWLSVALGGGIKSQSLKVSR
jgi:hypothetical protein